MASKIVFIVGAGASAEVGLPVGRKLAADIAALLDLKPRAGILTAPDQMLLDGMRHAAQVQNSNDFRPYFAAARRICEGLMRAPSIDTFIDNHRGDKALESVGKLAIVQSILRAEKGSRLYSDLRRPDIQPRLNDASVTWLARFWENLTEGCAATDLEERAASVTFVVFNYDRCIQHYLYHAAQQHYGIPPDQAEHLVQSIRFYHPYGSVGALPWKGKPKGVAYGGEVDPTELVRLATQIKTFTEGANPDSSEIESIRADIKTAERVVFLGFAYHRRNLELLWPVAAGHLTNTTRILGTALGISAHDIADIANELGGRAGVHPMTVDLIDTEAHKLFHARGRSLMLT